MSAERISDVVFGASPPERGRTAVWGVCAGVALHALLFAWAALGGPSLGAWSAELAMRVHAEVSRTEAIDLPHEEKPPPPAPPPPPPNEAREAPAARNAAVPAHEHRATALHQPPAQAGRVVARDAPADPADLTAVPFAAGTAQAYAGGATSSQGTSTQAVGSAAPSASAAPTAAPVAEARDLSQPIAPEGDTNCSWPAEADSEQIDQQSAVVSVTVGPDGKLEAATIAQDPGFGFGRAAVACARAMRFAPAKDKQGRAVRSTAAVRVHFWR